LRNDEAELEGIRLQPGRGIAGWVAQQGEPAIVADAYQDERFQPGFDREHTGFRARAVLAVPLTIKGRVIGVIEVINPLGAKPYFDDTDLALLQTLAASVAVAVENAWLYEKMRHSVTLETLQKTIVTLSHYVNNSLMVLSMLAGLLQDRAEEAEDGRQSNWLWRAGSTIQAEIRQLTAVLAALDQTTSVKETTYQGDVQMIDIQQELQARLEASSHVDGGVT
jgi:GAF domain-containing protein